jgi:hypothetical protein
MCVCVREKEIERERERERERTKKRLLLASCVAGMISGRQEERF